MRIVIYNSPCAPGLAGPEEVPAGLSGAFLCEIAVCPGENPGMADGCIGIAGGKRAPGGVLCVCGKDQAQ